MIVEISYFLRGTYIELFKSKDLSQWRNFVSVMRNQLFLFCLTVNTKS